MSDCNLSQTPMVEGLDLEPGRPDFIPDRADVTTYEKFIGSFDGSPVGLGQISFKPLRN